MPGLISRGKIPLYLKSGGYGKLLKQVGEQHSASQEVMGLWAIFPYNLSGKTIRKKFCYICLGFISLILPY